MRERSEALQAKLKGKLEELQKMKSINENLKTKFITVRDENLKLIDEEFNKRYLVLIILLLIYVQGSGVCMYVVTQA